jgi:hypothetical protein
MKYCAIPAQITSVEDKIVGNFSFKQIILLSLPLFLSALIYFLLPPFSKFEIYKIIIFLPCSLFMSVLSVRLKGQILLDWLILRFRYEIRPSIYINRTTDYFDNLTNDNKEVKHLSDEVKIQRHKFTSSFFKINQLTTKSKYIFNYDSRAIYKVSRKGSLDVYIKNA